MILRRTPDARILKVRVLILIPGDGDVYRLDFIGTHRSSVDD